MIHKESFGTLLNGKNADLFTLKNSSGMTVTITNYGAGIVSIITPDRHGHWADVALGYDNLNGYVLGTAYFGGVVGRYANRIAGGAFQLDGKNYHVTVNDGPNCLHGGKIGFNKVLWSAKILKSSPEPSIMMTYISPDGEEGFPGTAIVSVTYTLTEDNQIRMDFSGTSDRTTILNVCNHSYFNLTGDPTKSILDHELTIHAERYTPVDQYLIPTGELAVVANTPFDFRKRTRVGNHIDDDHDQIKKCNGYDLNWVLDSYTGSDSKIGNRQGGCLHLCQAEPTPKQPNLNKLGDGGGHKGNAKPTQHKPIFEPRAVYT
jgi:aldose 1-epimerase